MRRGDYTLYKQDSDGNARGIIISTHDTDTRKPKPEFHFHHPSHRPNLRNSCNTHSVLSLPSFSRSFSLPLSVLEVTDAPLDARCRAIDDSLGGDLDKGVEEGIEEMP